MAKDRRPHLTTIVLQSADGVGTKLTTPHTVEEAQHIIKNTEAREYITFDVVDPNPRVSSQKLMVKSAKIVMVMIEEVEQAPILGVLP